MNVLTPAEAYLSFVHSEKRLPDTISDLGLSASDGEALGELAGKIWKDYAVRTLELCVNDPAFNDYAAREKMLAYAFTLVETMKPDVEVIRLQLKKFPDIIRQRQYKGFFEEYRSFTDVLTEEGIQRGEIQNRPFISNAYPYLFQAAIGAVLAFWLNDSSEMQEQTDVAVEKIVHLVFDTIAPGAVDSALDLIQFLVKQRFNG